MSEQLSLVSVLAWPTMDHRQEPHWRRLMMGAALSVAASCLLLGTWSAVAPIAGAIVAPAEVKVERHRRTVQHLEGGIVREIRVRDGQQVHAGDALAVIGNVRSDADLALLREQRDSESARLARATAEAVMARGLDLAMQSEAARRQHALFVARRRVLDEQIAALNTQIVDARAQVAALASQVEATTRSATLADEELQINQKLVEQGFIQRTRLLALQRDTADYASRVGEQRGALAAARLRVHDLQSRIAQASGLYQQQGADEMKEATQRLRELDERLRAAQDAVDRQVLRAPVDGEVMALRVSEAGQAIGPREPVLDIVPGSEKLVVEARVRPQDIDSVREGGAAEVRVEAFDARRTPLLPGRVTFVSPDRTAAQDGRDAGFTATIEIDAGALASHPQLQLRAGMPAEVFITTGRRTLMAYLAKPLTAFMHRAMREP